ncbi:MAG: type-F conjugative transfer system secretin TraK [Rhabdochlamydiaceae bacterium]|nr:type-F conjugative transfer system secretin TraK [Candidatus Amphrikana amoebophyrae]
MNLKNYFWVYGILTSQCLLGLVESPINEKKPVEVELSSSSMNRICIDGGTVEKVIADHSLVDINIDEFTGQVFVSVFGELPQEGTTISIISGSGSVQDLFVTSAHKSSELVILNEKDWAEDSPEFLTLNLRTNSIDLLNDIIGGLLPHGYGYANNESVPCLTLPKGLESTLEQVIEGPFDRIALYHLKNTSRRSIFVSPGAFDSGEGGWTFLTDRQIKPKGSITCIISYNKEGEE